MMLLWSAIGLLVAVAMVLLWRTVRFTPKQKPVSPAQPVHIDEEAAIAHLQQMVSIPTISDLDESNVNEEAFKAFRQLLADIYPATHSVLTREEIGTHGLLYTWHGQNPGGPTVLMAHYDVVPVIGQQWKHPPFVGEIVDEELWGRGTLDTKGTMMGILEAVEKLVKEGFKPQKDVYLAFGGDEEVMGKDAAAIVDVLQARGVHPALVLDEGGAVVKGVFPGVRQPAAVIGIAEKGSCFLDITATAPGGHASAPPVEQSLAGLSRALIRIVNKPMPFTITKAARELFDVMGRQSTFAYRFIFANLWCFAPLLNLLCKTGGGELNALVRSTCALTRAKAADAYNVLPEKAVAGINVRIIPGESVDEVVTRMEDIIGDKNISVTVRHASPPSEVSETYDESWMRIETAIRQTYSNALVTPYLMLALSDSRHYCRISSHVYRFSGMPLTKEQRGLIHNANERIPLNYIKDLVAFYVRILQES